MTWATARNCADSKTNMIASESMLTTRLRAAYRGRRLSTTPIAELAESRKTMAKNAVSTAPLPYPASGRRLGRVPALGNRRRGRGQGAFVQSHRWDRAVAPGRLEQVFLGDDQLADVVLRHVVARSHGDRTHGTGLLAVAAEDASGEVDLVARAAAATRVSQPTHFSSPSSYRWRMWRPRWRALIAGSSSGYSTVVGGRKRCLKV